MGIYASYYAIDDNKTKEYQTLLSSNDNAVQQQAFDDLFSLRDNEDYYKNHYLDLDKLWDGLHFLLTGCASYDDDETVKTPAQNALYDGFFGQEAVHDDGLHFTDKTRVVDIVKALESIDIEALLADIDFETFAEADLYPDIWDDIDDEMEEICDDFRHYFAKFKQFYQNALTNNRSVLITIW